MNNIWITFADNEIYLKSAYALALSLKKVNSIYPLCLMYPCGIKQTLIDDFKIKAKNLNIIYKEVPYLFFNCLSTYKQNVTINKLHLFSLIEYNKICFIDADSFFTKNIDFIFNEQTPMIGYYFNNKFEQCFSGGIFLVKPSLSFYSTLLNLCISLQFYDDDNLFFYLVTENLLKFKTYINDILPEYRNIILQEQKPNKYFASYSYEEISKLVFDPDIEVLLKNYIDF